MTTQAPPCCLLCSGSSVAVQSSLTGAQIRKLWSALGSDISEAAFGPVLPETAVEFYLCRSCGFRFYRPDFAGSALFYEDLMSSKDYPVGGLDFDDVIDFAGRHGIERVLDVGGGEGAFLDLARKAGMKTSGIEVNRHASEAAARKGHRMFTRLMEEISLDEVGGGTDLLTLFQVVEHVPDPVGFVVSASRLVKPGGFIAIAVPSDKRMLGLLENDPADWPPHHISRWRAQDLRSLAEKAGLEVVEERANRLFGTDIPWAFELHDRLEGCLGRNQLRIPKPLVFAASVAYRALQLQAVMPFHGPSIQIVLRKSAA